MKKFFTYPVFVVLFLSFIGTILFGSILKHHYLGGERFKTLQNIALLISSIPGTLEEIFLKRSVKFQSLSPVFKWEDKEMINLFKDSDEEGLIILSRYDAIKKRSVVEIRELSTLNKLHTYEHDINKMYDLLEKQKIFFDRVEINGIEERFSYGNPYIDEDLNLYAIGNGHVFFKIDSCSNLIFANNQTLVHHSINMNSEKQFLVPSKIPIPYSKYVSKFKFNSFDDDAISIIDQKGSKIFEKSVVEILLENKILGENLFMSNDPIHLNDIEEFKSDSLYWKKGDLLLSARNLSAIIHYRPNINKVINYIFNENLAQIHDIEILSDQQISFLHNNNDGIKKNNISEVIIYDFKSKSFERYFSDILEDLKVHTYTAGLAKILPSKSLLLEETDKGRLIFINQQKELVWEFINLDDSGRSYPLFWFRIIKNNEVIEKFKKFKLICN